MRNLKGKINNLMCFLVSTTLLLIIPTTGIASKKPFEGMTIKISIVEDNYRSGMKRYVEPIVEKELGCKLKYSIGPSWQVYQRDMMEFATGASAHQIVITMTQYIADYAPHVVPLEPLLKKYNLDLKIDDIDPSHKNIGMYYKGVLYGVPFDGDQRNLYYNKTAFNRPENKKAFREQYGYELRPPKTWKQYLDMAKFFDHRDWDGDGKIEYGIAEHFKRGQYAFWTFISRFAPLGGVYFDKDMNPLINTPNGLAALENEIECAKYAAPGAINFDSAAVKDSIARGNVAMAISWSSCGLYVMEPTRSTNVGNIGVALVPGWAKKDGTINHRPGAWGGWVFLIPKYTTERERECAIRIIEIASRPEIAKKLALDLTDGVDPYRLSTFNSKEWKNLWPEYPDYSKQYAKVTRESVMAGLYPDLQICGANEYITSVDDHVIRAIQGKESAKEALKNIEEEWNRITDRLGKERQLEDWRSQLANLHKIGIKFTPIEEFDLSE